MSDAPLPPVTAAVTPMPLPESFGTPQAAMLAHDVAVNMYEEPVLLRKHGLSPGQYETLRQYKWFQVLVRDFTEQWNAPKNAQQRLAQEAIVGIESVLPDLIARMKVKNEPLAGIAQLCKIIADIAGVGGANKVAAPQSEKFSITINLGADVEVYEKTKPVEVDVLNDPVPQISRGIQSLLALQTEPEGTGVRGAVQEDRQGAGDQ